MWTVTLLSTEMSKKMLLANFWLKKEIKVSQVGVE
jgi:hypothetical protein